MFRKSLIVLTGFLGLFLAGTAIGTTPAAAGYACGPWNNWCRPACGPWNGWCAYFAYPRYGPSYGYNKHWNKRPYTHRHGYNHSRGRGHGHGHHANKGGNWR